MGTSTRAAKLGPPAVRSSVIARDPEVQGGTAVFRGTRVPVDILLDYVEGGQSIDAFVAEYPSIGRDDAVAAIQELKSLLQAG